MPYNLRCPDDFFRCRQCGECCIGFGGTRLSHTDIENIAAYLKISPEKLVNTYCRRDKAGSLQLGQKADGYCVFWNGLCTIHPVKPRMCKAWPFIESVLIDPENWRIMSGMCAGINPDVPLDQLQACVRRQLAALDGKPAMEICENQGDADQ